jgi:3-hydroxyisobutyrate dehydrogenase-like beta-hydroxyacid dehydrogenase
MSSHQSTLLTPKIGIVGLGLVGRALAQRLKDAGYVCIGSDVRQEAMDFFAAQGYAIQTSVAQLAQSVNTLILAVFDTSGVQDVVRQILQDKPNHSTESALTLMDCSTGDPLALEKLASQLKANGVHFLEAPLSGSSVQIENGEATLLLGGETADVQRLDPLLKVLATQSIHVGGVGMAARAKLATNLVLGLNRAALAEGMVFAESMGIAPQAFLDLVLATPARSDAAVVKGSMMVNAQFAPQSRIRQHLKDVQLMLDMAQAHQQNLPLSQTHAALMRDAVAAGDSELDNAAIVQQIRRSKLHS